MIYRTQREKINAYFDNVDAISQSQLKLFLGGIDKYLAEQEAARKNEYYDEPADHFIIGSAVDCKLTEGEDAFKEQYHISTLDKKPSDKVISILRNAFDTVTQGLEEVTPVTVNNVTMYTDQVIAACEYENYQPRYGVDAKLNALAREGAAEYWNELIASANKQILTLENMALINRVVDSIKFAPEFAFLFNEALHVADDAPNIDIFFQVPIYTQLNGIQVKALLDIVIVDHDRETIKVVDLKTMGDTVINFARQTRKRRYDIQIAFYNDLVEALRARGDLAVFLMNLYGVDGDRIGRVDSYHLDYPEFIVQSTKYANIPVTFQAHSSLLTMGRDGRTNIKMAYVNKEESSKFYSMDMEDIYGYRYLLNEYSKYKVYGDSGHKAKYTLHWMKIN